MGDVGAAASAGLYVASNIYSWKQAKQMPKLQAKANKEVQELQKAFADEQDTQKRNILRVAMGQWEAEVNSLINDTSFQDAYPDVPRSAEYVPVDPCCEQRQTIECNMDNVARADAYYQDINRKHEQNDLIHALSFDKCFMVNLDMQARQIQDAMRGIMSTGDVVEILTDTAEQAHLTGRVGNVSKITGRNLGISKMRLQARGRAEFREATTWFNSSVSPLQRQGDIREMMNTPAQRIQLALSQAQLIQNSLQNKNNALAQKSPFLLAKLQARMGNLVTKLQYRASEALLTNNFTPNFAATVAAPVQNTGQLFNILGSAVENAQKSHYYGPPAQSQDGFGGASVGGSINGRVRTISERPAVRSSSVDQDGNK